MFSNWKRHRSAYSGWFLTAPAVILAAGLIIYPFGFNIWLSFINRSARRVGSFVGFDNYERIFTDTDFYLALFRTTTWTVSVVIGQIVLGLMLALILNQSFKGRGFIRAAMLLPYSLSIVVVVFIWRWLLNDINGIINFTMMSLGVIGSPIVFLGSSSGAMITMVVIAIWQATPFTVLFLLAGLQSIPKELYESALVDGSGRWTQFRYITLPLLRPVLATVVLIKTIWTFNWFDLIWLYTGGGPADATRTLAVAVYEEGLRRFRFSEAAAIGVVMLICILLIAYPLARWAEKEV